MTNHEGTRSAPRVAGMAAALAAALMGLAAIGTGVSIGGLANAAAAATNAGNATVITPATAATPLVPLSSGGSSTQFTLKLPDAAFCTGDSANSNYRVQTYMVPSSVDPATIMFNSAGPVPVTGQFRGPLYDVTGSPYVNKQTSNATPPATTGQVQQPLPAFDYRVYEPGNIPPGTYNIGVACTLGPVSTTQVDKYWNLQKVFVANASDSPAQITWTFAAAVQATTTTMAAAGATTTVATTATTTAGSSTTSSTTAATASGASSSTSSTVGSSSSTSSTLLGSSLTTTSTTLSDGLTGSGSGGASGSAGTAAAGTAKSTKAGGLAKTGGSFIVPLAWAFLLVWLGRMAVLLGRRRSGRHGAP